MEKRYLPPITRPEYLTPSGLPPDILYTTVAAPPLFPPETLGDGLPPRFLLAVAARRFGNLAHSAGRKLQRAFAGAVILTALTASPAPLLAPAQTTESESGAIAHAHALSWPARPLEAVAEARMGSQSPRELVTIYDRLYPTAELKSLSAAVKAAEKLFQVNEQLLYSIIFPKLLTETSNFDSKAQSFAGAEGLMQVTPATAATIIHIIEARPGGREMLKNLFPEGNFNLKDARTNLIMGTLISAYNFEQINQRVVGGDAAIEEKLDLEAAAYHAGINRTKNLGPKTKLYIKRTHAWRVINEQLLKMPTLITREDLVYFRALVNSGEVNEDLLRSAVALRLLR